MFHLLILVIDVKDVHLGMILEKGVISFNLIEISPKPIVVVCVLSLHDGGLLEHLTDTVLKREETTDYLELVYLHRSQY